MARVLMIAYANYAVDARVKRHAQALAERGDSIDVICLASPQQGKHNGVNVIGLKIPRYRGGQASAYLLSYSRFFVTAGLEARRLAVKDRYDVAIVCSIPDAMLLCALPLKFMGTKLVLDVHDTMPELFLDKFPGWRGQIGANILRLEERFSALFADRVLAVHEPHRRRLIDAGIKPNKVRTVVNAPNRRIFRGESEASERNDDRPFMIVCHGTITRRLGVDVALQALCLLRGRIPNLRFRLIGNGDYLEEIRNQIAKLELEDLTELVPPIPLEELPRQLRGASVGLIPNVASSATHLMLPVKLMEYVAMQIPVVASRLRTIEHYFGDESVRFFEPGDPADLARAIEAVFSDEAAKRVRICNAQRVLETIDWKEQRVEYLSVIDGLSESQSISETKIPVVNPKIGRFATKEHQSRG